VSRLGQIEIVTGRVVRAVAGERAVAGPLHDLDVGILSGDLVAHLVEALDFDAEMIEPRPAPAAPRDQRHAEIAVTDRDRADFARGVARCLEPEHRAVEHPEQRVVVARDGQMIELAEHWSLPASRIGR